MHRQGGLLLFVGIQKLGSLHAQLLHIQIYDLHILEEDPLLLGCLQLWWLLCLCQWPSELSPQCLWDALLDTCPELLVCRQQKQISLGSTKQVLSHLATAAMLSHRSEEADLNEVQSCFHAAASRPDGPAAPSILRTVLHISWASICSNTMGWGLVAECLSLQYSLPWEVFWWIFLYEDVKNTLWGVLGIDYAV